MDRLFRFLLLTVVLISLVSCGVFFTPLEERWNIADPKNELLTFNPIIDGYVHFNATPVWEDVTELIAWPDSKIIVLRFDTADFPDVVAASYLRLSAPSALSPDLVLYIYRIRRDWEPSTISYNAVDTPGDFYDDSVVTTFTVPGYVFDIQIPLGDVFSGEKDDLADGIVIYSSQNVTFHSNEPGISGKSPLLLVEPE